VAGEQSVREDDGSAAERARWLIPELPDPEELRALSGYAKLATLLKEAHSVLRGMDLEVPDRADFVRRLLVITAAARHDQDDATRRLERFLQAVDEHRRMSP
jgi:hypothetical protein